MSSVQTRGHQGPSAGWPAVTTETLPWATGAVFGAMTRRDHAAQRDHYEAAIAPAIAALDYAPPQQVAAAAEDAATESALRRRARVRDRTLLSDPATQRVDCLIQHRAADGLCSFGSPC